MRLRRFHAFLMPRFAGALVFAALLMESALANEPTVWPTAAWAESSPEAQGMSSAAIASIVDFGGVNSMDSVLITRHGKLVAEAYYAPFRAGLKHAVNSTTKGVIGTLTGMAIQDGLLASRDVPVLDFFPDHSAANLDASKKSMTIGNLVDMTSGLDWKERLDGSVPETMLQMVRSRDWQGFVLDRPMAAAPGQTFNYNSGNAHLMSSILAKRTGGSTAAYAQRRLFAPLGIKDVRWSKDPQGVETGGWGIYLQPRDMAKVGYLYLRKGRWDGQQLLPVAWVEQVFNASVVMGPGSNPAYHYASGWWTIPSKHAYMTAGFNRQLIIVLPDVDVVAVVTGRRHYPIATLVDMITASARSVEPLPSDSAGQQQLAESIRQVAVEKASPVATAPPLAAIISGKAWEFERNALGVKRLVLNLTASPSTYEVLYDNGRPETPSKPIVGLLGLDGYFRVSAQVADKPVGLKGAWIDPQTFRISSRSISEGEDAAYTLRFEGNSVNVSIQNNLGLKTQVQGHIAN